MPDEISNKLGLVYTFYSFKGGVGRSMALANIAALLAKRGKRILIMDWDLEAPGLERFFSPHLTSSRNKVPGILELVQSSGSSSPLSWQDCILQADLPGGGLVSIISAGREDSEYATRLREINWEQLFKDHNFGRYLERLRSEWIKEFDFVLIDSRTGVTDIGGICTIHLPDALVALFSTTHQSIMGVKDVMQRARQAHSEFPADRRRLVVIPILGRDESNSEYRLAEKWRREYAPHLKEFYSDWIPKTETAESAMDYLKIPYISYWSFGERLPVIEEDPDNPKKLAFSYQLIARLMLGGLDWEEVKKGTQSPKEQEEAQRLTQALQEAQRERQEARSREQLASYLGERYSPSLGEHTRRAKYRYWGLSGACMFALSSLSIFANNNRESNDLIFTFIIMIGLALICLIPTVIGFKSKKIAEGLKSERWLFEGSAEDYASLNYEHRFTRFVQRVDQLLRRSQWVIMPWKKNDERKNPPPEKGVIPPDL
jgi:MinD-like ATPase involved in chromosome partitioning or flagellar assembly